jgi:hypothetical protein
VIGWFDWDLAVSFWIGFVAGGCCGLVLMAVLAVADRPHDR